MRSEKPGSSPLHAVDLTATALTPYLSQLLRVQLGYGPGLRLQHNRSTGQLQTHHTNACTWVKGQNKQTKEGSGGGE
jgi:hypothetical protein